MVRKIILLFGILLSIVGCEDPIDVDLNENPSLLVVEAYVNWIKETKQTEQVVKLSTLSPYFSSQKNAVRGATVYITDEAARAYRFQETETPGHYLPLDTVPYVVAHQFTLHIEHQQQRYEATETFQTVASINRVEQEALTFFGRDALKFEVYSFDPPEKENYTYFKFSSPKLDAPEYNVYRDDFTNGLEYYGILVDSDFEVGDSIQFRQVGLSPRAYSYWNVLILQNTRQGGPFQPPPVNLTGNVVNLTQPEVSPLGYFRISEVSEVHYVVE